MNRFNADLPAFPSERGPGMTKREYFAAMAMQGYAANAYMAKAEKEKGLRDDIWVLAVKAADHLIVELDRETP